MVWPNFLILVCVYVFFFFFFFNTLFQCTDQVLFLASLTFPAGFFFFFFESVNEKPCPGQGGGESHLARGSGELSGVSALVGNRVILNDPRVLSFKLGTQWAEEPGSGWTPSPAVGGRDL